jgi:hypothetical protein
LTAIVSYSARRGLLRTISPAITHSGPSDGTKTAKRKGKKTEKQKQGNPVDLPLNKKQSSLPPVYSLILPHRHTHLQSHPHIQPLISKRNHFQWPPCPPQTTPPAVATAVCPAAKRPRAAAIPIVLLRPRSRTTISTARSELPWTASRMRLLAVSSMYFPYHLYY